MIAMALEPGARLGPYEIVSTLGTGGMGEVYKARDSRLDRMVAIKIIRSGFADDDDTRQRFEHEARLVAQISHPSVLVLHDFGIHEGAPYMVSEFLEGESLRALVVRGAIPPRRAIDIAREVAQGLAAAHDQGIVHRDLKPENILITKAGRAKILDFGIAKLAKQPGVSDAHNAPTAPIETGPGRIIGTVGYMSPEQVQGEPADSRSDIFAFGAIVHEMLTGKRLFVRGSAVESLNAILKEDAKEVSESGVAVSQSLESTLRRCLAKDPALRFQSAHDLAFALEIADTVSRKAEPSGWEPPRSPMFRMVLGIAALATLMFALGWFWPGRRPVDPGFEFRRLTYQPGASVGGARFAPDGQTIVYDGRFGSNPGGVFTTRVGSHEFRSLDLPPGTQVLAVSSTGELAIRLADPARGGVLAQVPLAGGAPRPLIEGVAYADWSPDGKDLAIVRLIPGGSRVEYPIGTVLAEVKRPSRFGRVAVSPTGDRVAFVEIFPGPNNPGRVAVVDRTGSKRFLTGEWLGGWGVAWSEDGSEVYFFGTNRAPSAAAATRGEMVLGPPAIRAVDMAGNERLVLKAFTELTLRDASRGRLLVTQTVAPNLEMVFLSPAEKVERDLAWLNWSTPADLTPDGNLVLFDESRTGDGQSLVYLRRTDGTPPVRLGEGAALALSADGAWAATVETKSRPAPIVLLPTGAGERRNLKNVNLACQEARFFPDGKQLLVRASEPGRNPRLYVLGMADEAPRALTPEGVTGLALSPDGSRVATVAADGKVMSFPTEGGEGEALAGFEPGDQPIQWSEDGKSIFALRRTDRRFDVFRVSLDSGRREVWRSHIPKTAQGSISSVFITPDGSRSMVVHIPSWLELYVVDGVR